MRYAKWREVMAGQTSSIQQHARKVVASNTGQREQPTQIQVPRVLVSPQDSDRDLGPPPDASKLVGWRNTRINAFSDSSVWENKHDDFQTRIDLTPAAAGERSRSRRRRTEQGEAVKWSQILSSQLDKTRVQQQDSRVSEVSRVSKRCRFSVAANSNAVGGSSCYYLTHINHLIQSFQYDKHSIINSKEPLLVIALIM